MQKTIAFFDFDGTITNRDTMLALAVYNAGQWKFMTKMAMLSPSLVALKLNILTAQKAKQLFLKTFFGGTPVEDFNRICERFSDEIIPSLIREDAWAAIQNHRNNGDEVVVVSASAENWIKHWCIKHEISFIASRLEIKDNTITGNLEGANCNGKEKVCRIKEIFNLADYTTIYAYGDSSGDQMMLGIATHPGFRVFNK